MLSLWFIEPGRLEWQEAPAPRLDGDGEALVRPIAASTCDLDQEIIRGRTPFGGPFAIGHEAVAEVVALGDAVTSLNVGDLVAVPWHIACGSCETCTRGLAAHCTTVPYGAMYGLPVAGDWGGLFDDVVRVPFADAMLVRLPRGVEPAAAASAGDNAALAFERIDAHLGGREKKRVLVLGMGSIGLYAVQIAIALNAETVYVDDDEERRGLAAELGAEVRPAPPRREDGTFSLAIDASQRSEWLKQALGLLEPEGICECVGIYFDDVALPTFEMFVRGVRLRLGRGNARYHMPAVLELIASDRIEPMRVVSETLAWGDAPEALAEPSLKPVFVRPRATASPARGPDREFAHTSATPATGREGLRKHTTG